MFGFMRWIIGNFNDKIINYKLKLFFLVVDTFESYCSKFAFGKKSKNCLLYILIRINQQFLFLLPDLEFQEILE